MKRNDFYRQLSVKELLSQEEQDDPFLKFLELRLSPVPPWMMGG